jgi:hypothetical protein
MKRITSYVIPALASLATLGFALQLGHYALAVFSLATIVLLLAGVARDYSPRRPRWEPQHRGFTRFPTAASARPALKLAA